ncbi:hypothetical protein [Nonomuraea glycinis]|uniref:hypothetical protein n=1 Tax=Nonomuraea glycinis TaxID=2047744 RepID=UPI00339F383A
MRPVDRIPAQHSRRVESTDHRKQGKDPQGKLNRFGVLTVVREQVLLDRCQWQVEPSDETGELSNPYAMR